MLVKCDHYHNNSTKNVITQRVISGVINLLPNLSPWTLISFIMDPSLLLNERNDFILAQLEACLKWRGPYL